MSFSRTPLQMAGDFFKEYALYFVFVILLAVIITQDSTFLNITNLSNILTQSSVRMIIALGVAGVIVTRGTDLSVGRQVGLAAVVAATMLQAVDNVNKVFPEMGVMPIPAVILLVCVIGALIGLLNGIIVAILNVTPFIATLGTMLIAYGVNSLYYDAVGSAPIAGFDSAFRSFTQGYFSIPMGGLGNFRLSYITIYALVAIVFTWVLWNKTRFGKNLFAIGGNPEAAAVSGVNVTLNLIGIYVLSGVFYAFGGMLEAGRIVESGPLTEVIRTLDGSLSQALLGIPPHDPSVENGGQLVDVLASGSTADRPVVALTSQHFGVTIPIVAGSVEHLAGITFSHLRLRVPDGTDSDAVVGYLRQLGADAKRTPTSELNGAGR